ncbi:MAG: Mrp/NBP35 family ATP-binding protein [Acidobacteriota bacterium]|jgi:ATP-binding protein involved in chromosome partitioning
MPSPPSDEQIVAALRRIAYPGYSRDLVSFGLVKGVEVHDDRNVIVTVQLPPGDPGKGRAVEEAIREQLGALEGVASVEVRAAPPPAAPAAGPAVSTQEVPGVRNLVAVASGKGGVGKSTLAVNLAVALAGQGVRTGLLDSDVYGPSIPLMMGIHEQPDTDGERILPLENHGVRTMSIGYLLGGDDAPVIWRGPMIVKALTQFLREVAWGELDYLVIDLPPGTGDAVLTLVQSVPLAGAVVVTTPQDVALIDAKKAVSMFRKTGVPILGIVENMSVYVCPSCGHRDAIFGEGGGKREAERLGVPFLGEIPLEPRVRVGGDEGTPITVADPESPVSRAFDRIAAALRQEAP